MTTLTAKDNLTQQQFIQYYRQILLPEVAEVGQQKLLNQHIMIVGVGGLGTHVAQQLAAAGIGHLYLVDDDMVESSNLPRQILFNPSSIGLEKVSCAAAALTKLNPDVEVSIYSERFNQGFSEGLFSRSPAIKQAHENGTFMLLDCSDNMSTRQLINQWCVNQSIPLVSASVTAFTGQLMLIDEKSSPDAGCYHCVFSRVEPQQRCQDMGVLGPTVAVLSSMQALTAMKYILNVGPADKQLHIFDGVTLAWQSVARHRDVNCPVCQHWPASPRAKVTNQKSVQQEAIS